VHTITCDGKKKTGILEIYLPAKKEINPVQITAPGAASASPPRTAKKPAVMLITTGFASIGVLGFYFRNQC
jgi:hypothetical protein